MATKLKGIYKGFKFITQIFLVKEREMEIGYPTDVRHVAHIGWDSQSTNAPGWMNQFKTPSDFSAMSLGSIGGETDPSFVPISSWTSLDFDQSMMRQPASSEIFNDAAAQPKDLPKVPKKHKRKKTKSSTSSPKSISSPSSRSSKSPKPKSSFAATVAATVAEMEIMPSHPELTI